MPTRRDRRSPLLQLSGELCAARLAMRYRPDDPGWPRALDARSRWREQAEAGAPGWPVGEVPG